VDKTFWVELRVGDPGEKLQVILHSPKGKKLDITGCVETLQSHSPVTDDICDPHYYPVTETEIKLKIYQAKWTSKKK